MIKFVFLGDQLVDGGKQFCFSNDDKLNPIRFTRKSRNNEHYNWYDDDGCYNSWDEFVIAYNENEEYANSHLDGNASSYHLVWIKEHPLSIFK